MEQMQVKASLIQASDDYIAATKNLYDTKIKELKVNQELAERKSELFAKGLITGSNETTRNAQIVEQTADLQEKILAVDVELLQAECQRAVAQMSWNTAREVMVFLKE